MEATQWPEELAGMQWEDDGDGEFYMFLCDDQGRPARISNVIHGGGKHYEGWNMAIELTGRHVHMHATAWFEDDVCKSANPPPGPAQMVRELDWHEGVGAYVSLQRPSSGSAHVLRYQALTVTDDGVMRYREGVMHLVDDEWVRGHKTWSPQFAFEPDVREAVRPRRDALRAQLQARRAERRPLREVTMIPRRVRGRG